MNLWTLLLPLLVSLLQRLVEGTKGGRTRLTDKNRRDLAKVEELCARLHAQAAEGANEGEGP
jgi:hypothetical protein